MVDFPKLSISGFSLFLTKTSDHLNQTFSNAFLHLSNEYLVFWPCVFSALSAYHCKQKIGNFKIADFLQVECVLILNVILNISTKFQHYHTSQKSIWLTFHE